MLKTHLNAGDRSTDPVDKAVDNSGDNFRDLWITSYQQVINNELTLYQQSY